jgi:hypothetical protein
VVTYAISSFGAGQGGINTVSLDDMTVTIIPEPSTVGLLGLGALSAASRRSHGQPIPRDLTGALGSTERPVFLDSHHVKE